MMNLSNKECVCACVYLKYNTKYIAFTHFTKRA